MKKFILGIDVSKEKSDVCLLKETQVLYQTIVKNRTAPIKELLLELSTTYGFTLPELLICLEHTGNYTYPLCILSVELELNVWIENPRQIKYCSGLQRGKDDKTDALRIALYAYRYQDKAHFFVMPSSHIQNLKHLIAERDLYLSDRAKYVGQLKDQKEYLYHRDYKNKSQRLKEIIQSFTILIKQIEKQMDDIIESDPQLRRQHQLLCSIEGIGERTAIKMIVETGAFKDFTNPRKFCSHAGVAPFRYTSGNSIRSRAKVSHRADKSIKALLHMAALTAATRLKGDMHSYYQRKIAEGKNKMTVLNAIRAKLVHRMFAVIKNDKLYQTNYQFYLQKS